MQSENHCNITAIKKYPKMLWKTKAHRCHCSIGSKLCSYFIQDRDTPLHIAVRTKNAEMMNLLLDHGASADAIDKVRAWSLMFNN